VRAPCAWEGVARDVGAQNARGGYKGGEAEATLAMLKGLAPVEDAYAGLGVLGNVAV
jgi:hypothetical protein